eukprot:1162117-Pelagomonas_calceolata.AAC.8
MPPPLFTLIYVFNALCHDTPASLGGRRVKIDAHGAACVPLQVLPCLLLAGLWVGCLSSWARTAETDAKMELLVCLCRSPLVCCLPACGRAA